MSAEKALVQILEDDSAVGNIAGDRIYPRFAPQGAQTPHLVYFRVSGPHVHAMNGPSGLEQARIQIDGFSRDYTQLKDLMAKCRKALNGTQGTFNGVVVEGIVLQDDSDGESAAIEGQDQYLHRHTQEYLVPART